MVSDIIVFTVATEENDGFRLFMKSAKKYGYPVKVSKPVDSDSYPKVS